ncbi:MAG: NADPH-dependent 7-cyano-7-deazaguanine reductase QueF [Cyanobacteria bacterium J06634_5]
MSVLPSPALPLGKVSPVPLTYDPGLLYPVPRAVGRSHFLAGENVPFLGCDRWDCFEVSWLTLSGIPKSAFAQIQYPADSPNIVESKSLKLYLTGFHTQHYDTADTLSQIIASDLQTVLETTAVSCQILPFQRLAVPTPYEALGICIDDAVTGDTLTLTTAQEEQPYTLLQTVAPVFQATAVNKTEAEGMAEAEVVEEQLYSQILRSLCPVTSQPDWASVVIRYRGRQLDRAALFKYIAAYRNHQGFHEACCEQIFTDIWRTCQPEALAVGCYFARRGGISITPIRYASNASLEAKLKVEANLKEADLKAKSSTATASEKSLSQAASQAAFYTPLLSIRLDRQ